MGRGSGGADRFFLFRRLPSFGFRFCQRSVDDRRSEQGPALRAQVRKGDVRRRRNSTTAALPAGGLGVEGRSCGGAGAAWVGLIGGDDSISKERSGLVRSRHASGLIVYLSKEGEILFSVLWLCRCCYVWWGFEERE